MFSISAMSFFFYLMGLWRDQPLWASMRSYHIPMLSVTSRSIVFRYERTLRDVADLIFFKRWLQQHLLSFLFLQNLAISSARGEWVQIPLFLNLGCADSLWLDLRDSYCLTPSLGHKMWCSSSGWELWKMPKCPCGCPAVRKPTAVERPWVGVGLASTVSRSSQPSSTLGTNELSNGSSPTVESHPACTLFEFLTHRTYKPNKVVAVYAIRFGGGGLVTEP